MAIPQNKLELQQAILVNYQKLLLVLMEIPADQTQIFEMEGHTQHSLMSLHQLISYLVGWGQLLMKWMDRKEQGIAVDFPETGFRWNELGLLAQKFYRDYEDVDFETLKIMFEQTIQEIQKIVERKSNEELYHTPWYNQWTLGRMIQLNTASPMKNAVARIRKWKKQKAI